MKPAVLALLLAAPKLELSVGAGVDSNPFELPDDQQAAEADQAPRTGAFVPVEAEGLWKTPRNRMFRAGVDAWFDGRFYGWVGHDPAAAERTRASDASRWSAQASAPLVFDPQPRSQGWSFELTAEPFFGMHRETYTSHVTGTPFLVDTTEGPIDTFVDISRRYDANEYGVAADGDLGIGRLFDAVAGVRYTAVDYLVDYEETLADDRPIDSWDYEELRVDVDAYVRPGIWSFAAGTTIKVREYQSRFPRDGDTGEKVLPGDPAFTPQVFTFRDATLKGGIVTDPGRAVLRFRIGRRTDAYEGYQSYSETSLTGDFRLVLGEEGELRFEPGYSVRTYDELRVNYDPAEKTTDRRRLSMDARIEGPAFSRWTRVYVQAGLVSQTSENALYSHTAFQAMTGVRCRWR